MFLAGRLLEWAIARIEIPQILVALAASTGQQGMKVPHMLLLKVAYLATVAPRLLTVSIRNRRALIPFAPLTGLARKKRTELLIENPPANRTPEQIGMTVLPLLMPSTVKLALSQPLPAKALALHRQPRLVVTWLDVTLLPQEVLRLTIPVVVLFIKALVPRVMETRPVEVIIRLALLRLTPFTVVTPGRTKIMSEESPRVRQARFARPLMN